MKKHKVAEEPKASTFVTAKLALAKAQDKVRSRIKEEKDYMLKLLHPDDQLQWMPVVLEHPQVFYKVVAVVGGQLISVFDGSTVYRLGKWLHAKHGAACWPPLYGCLYAYQQPQKALEASFPDCSVLKSAPKVLIEVEAQGYAYTKKCSSGVWALSKLRVRNVMTQLASSTGSGGLAGVKQQLGRPCPPGAQLQMGTPMPQKEDVGAVCGVAPSDAASMPASTGHGGMPMQQQPASTILAVDSQLPSHSNAAAVSTRGGLQIRGSADDGKCDAGAWHSQLRSMAGVSPATASKPAFRPAGRSVQPKQALRKSSDAVHISGLAGSARIEDLLQQVASVHRPCASPLAACERGAPFSARKPAAMVSTPSRS